MTKQRFVNSQIEKFILRMNIKFIDTSTSISYNKVEITQASKEGFPQ